MKKSINKHRNTIEKINKAFFSLLVFILICFACNQNSNLTDNQMVFNVDTTLLSKLYFDSILNIEYKTPKSWVEYNISNIDSLKTNGLLYYYVDSNDHKSALMIYDIRKLETKRITNILNSPEKYLNQNKFWDTIVSDTFTYNNFSIHQLMFQNKSLIAFNLYYSKNNKYIFYTAYSSDINKYQARAKDIESSIGSFK